MMMTGLILIASYLIGSIPSGLILTRLFGYGDIRNIGSGNIGATNVMRTGNKGLALLTFLCDGMKGFLPVFLLHSPFLMVSGLCIILGHIFPIWLRFKGGKGVATAIGVILALNYVAGVSIILLWLITFRISRISSLSALTAFAGATIFSFALSKEMVIFMLLITMIIFFTHRENISRLLKGKEHKWSKK